MSFGETSAPIRYSDNPDKETIFAGILAGIQADYSEFFHRIFPALKSFLDQPRFPNAESVVLKEKLTCFFRYFSSLHTAHFYNMPIAPGILFDTISAKWDMFFGKPGTKIPMESPESFAAFVCNILTQAYFRQYDICGVRKSPTCEWLSRFEKTYT
jgi:hypothetical protein